jgi:hypothetical protein
MSPAVKNAILVVVVAVVVVGAVFIYKKRTKDTTYTDDPNLVTHWMCEETGAHFDLTPAKYQDWMNSPDKVKHDPNQLSRLVVFQNPTTGRYTVVRAEIDPLTREWFIPTNSKGEAVPPPEKIQKAKDELRKANKKK